MPDSAFFVEPCSMLDKDIRFYIKDKEMLRISPDGFYVEGRKVAISDPEKHDKEVYQALRDMLLKWKSL